MGVIPWSGVFLLITTVCAWIVFGNGIETLAGLMAALLLGADITRWSDSGIRFFVAAIWIALAVWFVLGLFEPSWRLL